MLTPTSGGEHRGGEIHHDLEQGTNKYEFEFGFFSFGLGLGYPKIISKNIGSLVSSSGMTADN